MIRTTCRAILLSSGLWAAAPAMATTFSFDAYAPTNASNPLTISAGGINASFNSPSGAGAFIAEDGSGFATLGSSVFADDNFAPEELDISFSKTIASIILAFATNDSAAPTLVTLTATLGGVTVGTIPAIGTIAASGLPEGVLSFGGAGFNAVEIVDADPGNEGFAIGAVTVSVPEPSALLVLGAGLFSLAAARRRF